jgi:hypothetical protein
VSAKRTRTLVEKAYPSIAASLAGAPPS